MPMVEELINVIKRFDENGNEILPDGPRVYLCLLELMDEQRIWESFMGFKDGADSPEGKAYYIGMDGTLQEKRRSSIFSLCLQR